VWVLERDQTGFAKSVRPYKRQSERDNIMGFVLVRNEDGKFVCPPGAENSYTSDLTKARIFSTREAAEQDKCGNERVHPVTDFLQGSGR